VESIGWTGDRLTPPRSAQKVAAEISHSACYTIANAGHQAMQEQPDAVHAVMDGFLASVGKRRRDDASG
jgi:pimeloyl-ACP methyl ester carboxylesterase